MSISIPISTSFGQIRAWRAEDAAALAKYVDRYAIWLQMRQGFFYPYSPELAKQFLESVDIQDPVRVYALATPQEAVGGIGLVLNPDMPFPTADLGYWLGLPYWNREIMVEAVIKFSEYVFDRFALARLYAKPFAYNDASVRVLEKAGFALEGRLGGNIVKDGQFVDQLVYVKTRPEA